MKIEVGKLFKTRCGERARIYAIGCDSGANWAHGAVFDGGHWEMAAWTEDGLCWNDGEEHLYDLVDVWPEQPESTSVDMSTFQALIDFGNRSGFDYSYVGESPRFIEPPHPLYIEKPTPSDD